MSGAPSPEPGFEERVRAAFGSQRLLATLGAELSRVEPGVCEIRVPWREELGQQHGFFHAGVIATAADSAAGFAAYSLMPLGSGVLSVEFKVNLLRPANGDAILARAEVVRAGRTLMPCRTDVFVEEGEERRLCATALLTMIRREET